VCQVNGPDVFIGCSKCGAGYYENNQHICKKFVSFEKWDADLQKSAKEKYTGSSILIVALYAATRRVARWPKWKRHCVWAEQFQHSIK